MNSITEEHFTLGKKFFFRYDKKGAEEAFREALTSEPNDPTILGWLAITLALLKKYDDAIEVINQIEGKDTAEVYITRGVISDFRDGNKKDAIDQFSKAITCDPNNELSFSRKGLLYSKIKRETEAFSDMENAIKINPSAYVYIIYGHVKEKFADKQGALSSYEKAARIDPENSRAWAFGASIRKDIGEYDQALVDFNKAIELDPNFVWAIQGRGTLKFINLTNKHGALADYSKAIELDPKCQTAWANRGSLQTGLGNYQAALGDYSKAIELDPSDVWSLYKRAELKFNHLNDKQGALTDYSKAIEFDPEYKWAWAKRGSLNESMGDLQGALDDLNRAIEIDNDFSWAINRRFNVYKSLGNYELCLTDRRKYYEVTGIPKYNFEDPQTQNISDSVFVHLSKNILPQLNSGGEKLIEFWECNLYWGDDESLTRNQNNQPLIRMTGKYGVGYIVLSDKYLRIISLGHLSKTYGKHLQIGLGKKLLLAALGNYDLRRVDKNDQYWRFPFKDINNISKANDVFHLVTSSETWEIASYFSDDEYLQAALEIARTGNLRKLIDLDKIKLQPKQSGSEDEIFEKIERLASLREKGILTKEKFEQKKKELLARI